MLNPVHDVHGQKRFHFDSFMNPGTEKRNNDQHKVVLNVSKKENIENFTKLVKRHVFGEL